MAQGRRRTLLSILLIIAVAMIGISMVTWRYLLDQMDRPGPLTNDAIVTIPRGVGFSEITRILSDAGALDDAFAFRIMARLTSRDRNLKAGEYAIAADASPNAILDALESGDSILYPITVPEGFTVYEVFERLEEANILTGDLPPDLPEEGSLLPETYLVARGESRTVLVDRMSRAMVDLLDEVWERRADDLPLLSKQEALILASIIEKETSIPEEYPIVAGVFANRLKRGMKLQTDPTVIYALTEGEGSLERRLTRDDLQVNDEYNTYMIDGLPPGPIANPGRAALEAAVNPAKTDYLFFVADGTGGHAFGRTLEEHNRNVRHWRRVRDKPRVRTPIPVPRPSVQG